MCLVAGNAGSPRWGLVRVDQRAHRWACFEGGDGTSFYVERIGIRGCWKKRLDGITWRDRLWRVAWRQAGACGKKPALRSIRVGRWTHGVKPRRVTGSGCAQLPLCPQWPRMKSDRGRQYRNASRAGHGEIRTQSRVVSGKAVRVTTALRWVVTRPFAQDRKSPACSRVRETLSNRPYLTSRE
jgi:hypothetical protein